MTSRNKINSVVGQGSFFEGKFYIAGSLHVDGKFEGEIKTNDALVVGNTGKVKTNIHAKSVRIEGTMIGNVYASNEVHLEPTSKVLGDIHAPTVHVAPGVIAKGSINITGNSKKNPRTLIEETYDGVPQTALVKERKELKSIKK